MDSHDREKLAPRLGRRRILAGGLALAGVGIVDGFLVEPNWLDVSEHAIRVAGLPQALDGLRVAQVTDAHLKGIGRVELSIIEALRRLGVQLVVLTGDIVDHPSALPVLRELVSLLRGTRAEVVATLGNWEHWAGFTSVGLDAEYRRLGARLLVNEAAIAAGVAVVATDDGYAGAPRWDHTLASFESVAGSGAPRILLTHSPALLDHGPGEAPRFDLALSGHTHGGQLRAGPLAPWIPPGSGRFVAGFYDTALGRAYVSRGTGTSIVNARFLCRPELPVFRLTRA